MSRNFRNDPRSSVTLESVVWGPPGAPGCFRGYYATVWEAHSSVGCDVTGDPTGGFPTRFPGGFPNSLEDMFSDTILSVMSSVFIEVKRFPTMFRNVRNDP